MKSSPQNIFHSVISPNKINKIIKSFLKTRRIQPRYTKFSMSIYCALIWGLILEGLMEISLLLVLVCSFLFRMNLFYPKMSCIIHGISFIHILIYHSKVNNRSPYIRKGACEHLIVTFFSFEYIYVHISA